jgi:predicted dehydrogenase
VGAARAAIADGRLGVVTAVHYDLLAGHAQGAPLVGALSPTLLGGEWTRLGPLALGVTTALIGTPLQEIYAVTSQAFFEAHRQAGVEDLGMVSAGYESGFSATLVVGRAPLGRAGGALRESVRVRGTRGSLSADSPPGQERILVETAVADMLSTIDHGTRPLQSWSEARDAWLHTLRSARPPFPSTPPVSEEMQ